MGKLKGDVDILGLGNLLQLLSLNRREGILSLSRGSERKAVHFAPGEIRLLSTTSRRVNKIGKILRRKRLVTRQDLDALLKEQKLLRWKLGQIAVTSGLVKKRDVAAALREQVEEEIFDMFMWSRATFEFDEEAKPDHKGPLSGVSFDTDVTALLLEAARRTDEMEMTRRILDDDDMTLRRYNFDIVPEELGEDVEVIDAVLPLIDGKRTLRDIISQSIYPRFTTLRAIYALFRAGHVKAHDRRGRKIRLDRRAERVEQPWA